MALVQLLTRYLPNVSPRETSDEMREYLRSELNFLALTMNASLELLDALRSAPRMYLVGDVDDFNLDTIETTLVNYSQGGSLGNVPVEPDLATGEITLPLAGAYKLVAYVYGLQASVTQNETIHLKIAVNGDAQIIGALDVLSNQTQDRTLAVTLTRGFDAGDVITMVMSATGDLGNFAMQETSLELTFTQGADDPGAQANILWFP
jgi:hypothetical protein